MVESEFCFCVRSQVPPQTPDLNLNVKGPVTCNFALLLVSNVILIAFDKEKGATRHRHRRRQHDRTEYTPLVTRWLSPSPSASPARGREARRAEAGVNKYVYFNAMVINKLQGSKRNRDCGDRDSQM